MSRDKSIKLQELFTLKNKNVLIIGGAGYLGTPMTETFAELKANVILASRNEIKSLKVIKKIQKNYKNKNIYFIKTDITDENSLKILKVKMVQTMFLVYQFKMFQMINI